MPFVVTFSLWRANNFWRRLRGLCVVVFSLIIRRAILILRQPAAGNILRFFYFWFRQIIFKVISKTLLGLRKNQHSINYAINILECLSSSIYDNVLRLDFETRFVLSVLCDKSDVFVLEKNNTIKHANEIYLLYSLTTCSESFRR